MKELDLRDLEVIKLINNKQSSILTVGCGRGSLEWHLHQMGHVDILATDIVKQVEWNDTNQLVFAKMDILNPIEPQRDIVICIEVIEHIKEYGKAIRNLIKLARKRVIITTPYKYSYNDPGHCNHWDDDSINFIRDIAKNCKISISKIITKQKDLETGQRCFLICVDK